MDKRYPNTLRRHRNAAGLSYKQVALLLGIRNQAVISQWEKGLAMPSSKHLMTMMHLYSTCPQELYPEYDLCLAAKLQEKLNRYGIKPIKFPPPHRSTER